MAMSPNKTSPFPLSSSTSLPPHTSTTTKSSRLETVLADPASLALASLGLVASGFALGVFADKLIKQARIKAVSGKRVAVILCGAGYLDGTEITEAVAVLTALSEFRANVQVFAPDATQADVVDHASSSAKGFAPRNMLQESARISRGKILPLTDLNEKDFDVLIIPGGFGVAKSLSKWATLGPEADYVDPQIKSLLLLFRAKKKVVGLCCISPVLALKTMTPCVLTLGKPGPEKDWPYGGTIAAAKTIKGVTHVECDVTEICVDQEARLVTTPAYMSSGPKHEIVEGVRKMVYAALQLAGQ